MTPRIAIIGAGPGGLTCARVLQRRGIAVTVLERDTSPTARGQGGTLDMHPSTGQAALRAAGLLDEFMALARPEGQEMRLYLPSGAVLMRHAPGPDEPERPEIDRPRLRRLLLDALAPGTVRWGCAVASVGPGARITTADGTAHEYDLVVGADGAWSTVRPLLSPAVPAYTGVTFVETSLDDVDRRHPAVAELLGQGMASAHGFDKSLMLQRNSGGHVRVYAAIRAPEDRHTDLHDTEAVRADLLRRFAEYDESFLAVLRESDSGFVSRPLYALPVPHTWAHRPGLTLLGDAAHLMSPFSGQGANLAMLDGADLAESIAAHRTDGDGELDEAVRAYETTMVARGAEAARMAAAGLANAISRRTPEQRMQNMHRMLAEMQSSDG